MREITISKKKCKSISVNKYYKFNNNIVIIYKGKKWIII